MFLHLYISKVYSYTGFFSAAEVNFQMETRCQKPKPLFQRIQQNIFSLPRVSKQYSYNTLCLAFRDILTDNKTVHSILDKLVS